MATRSSIAVRKYVAQEAIDAAIMVIADGMGVKLAPVKTQSTNDPAYREMVSLEGVAQQLTQIAKAFAPVMVNEPDEALNAGQLGELTVSDLRGLAAERGIEVDAKARKTEIIDALIAHDAPQAPSQGDSDEAVQSTTDDGEGDAADAVIAETDE